MANTINQAAVTVANLLDGLPWVDSIDFLTDAEAAADYVNMRSDDAAKFVQSIDWKSASHDCEVTKIYGVTIVKHVTESAGRVWGQLFKYKGLDVVEEKTFGTFEQFVAYMLARYW